jgi:CheY-like chemotaxis protein
MSVRGPMLIIEDDEDDQDFYRSTLQGLNIENEIVFFGNAEDAYRYLEETTKQPFLIISDINLPGISGIEFKKKVQANEYLKQKSIPFVFVTTSGDRNTINAAYNMMVQGYFIKPNSVTELAALLDQLLGYWKICKHPNSL